ncbi:LuxR C-terminal-related transcriptional regulator [Leucobacter albus]|uniref:LuxR C-terminal-related transcriptional regulator n=1 Tax=Leucobacter albus TaxID=272210 RepID=A0ABW3TLN0_9MICO
MAYVFREEILSEAVAMLGRGRGLLVVGHSGSGRTSFLTTLEARLREQGGSAVAIAAASPELPRTLHEAPVSSAVLIDAFEQADARAVSLVRDRLSAGGALVVVLDPSNHDSQLAATLQNTSTTHVRQHALFESLHPLVLAPLEPFEIKRLLHSRSEDLIDAATEEAIVELAKGRPRWALDLLHLAQMRTLSTFPRPGLNNRNVIDETSGLLRSIAEAFGGLSPESAAAAVALASLGPLDHAGIKELIGTEHAHTLTRKGVLMRHDDEGLAYVPRLLGAALSTCASPSHIDRYERAIQSRLLKKAAAGFPLTEHEVQHSIRAFPQESSHVTPVLRTQQSDLIGKSISRLSAFGEHSLARSLLLRENTPELFDGFVNHAAVLGELVSPTAGLALLEADEGETSASLNLPAQFIRARLDALARTARHDAPTQPDSGRASPNAGVSLALDLWNADRRIPTEVPQMRRVAAQSKDPAVNTLVTVLTDLEEVWNGYIPQGSWLDTGAPLPTFESPSEGAFEHLVSTVLVAQSYAALLAGQFAKRRHELQTIAANTSLREYHARWMRHFAAAATALPCGDVARAALEWERFLACAPQYLPLRLRSYLALAKHELELVARSDAYGPSGDSVLSAIISYMAGHVHQPAPPAAAEVSHQVNALPILKLREAHRAAASAGNPFELLHLGLELRTLEKWAPSAIALAQSRRIFVRRRSVSGVHRCDEATREIKSTLRHRIAWYRPELLPVPALDTLTPRERETAKLAAQGLSNRQIAAQLHCSIRTVESHIAQARAKLGAATRQDLANVALH